MFACPQKFDDSKQVFLAIYESKIIIKPTNCGSMETSVKTELNSPCCPNQQISTNYVQKWNSRTRTYSYGTG
ncbi:AAEL010293-PA [Aedes aegypti]|uniref:AAEL010293-PA n=1 Tax=Aedes aegypti TaxID=7159 RepID=Q16TC5_AEDAE|nr:AAEL010293-PA [Aedes aegypti]